MFRPLTESIFVSPQIAISDIEEAKERGVTLIINNRPDDEEPGQIAGGDIEQAAKAVGLSYIAIPITHSGFSQPQVQAMVAALKGADGGVLAYCRSGTRSTNLWALAQASIGDDPDALTEIAAQAGYDLSPVRPLMDMLKAQI